MTNNPVRRLVFSTDGGLAAARIPEKIRMIRMIRSMFPLSKARRKG
jgi:hypothetical protein